MSKKIKAKKITSKKCGESWLANEVPTNKEWTKLAPMPDSEGRITIVLMATWSCPNCGKTVMSSKAKYKDDGTTGPSKKDKLIEKINETENKISISELASELSFSEENIEKAIQLFMKNKLIKGKIENGYFVKE
ncbi:MAG: hypothetical protein FK731_00040 [Asgard group archaeon]|nr:hypothetical protein [Asgard group archaeon]